MSTPDIPDVTPTNILRATNDYLVELKDEGYTLKPFERLVGRRAFETGYRRGGTHAAGMIREILDEAEHRKSLDLPPRPWVEILEGLVADLEADNA